MRSVQCLLISVLLFSATALRADLSQLDFMVGNWISEDFGRGATENWARSDTSMAGMFYGTLNDGRVITEFMLIEKSGDEIVLRWNHFNEDYSRWESEPIEHYLVESSGNKAKFEMKPVVKGLPRHLIYTKEKDSLTVWVGDDSNPTGAFELTFKPQL